MKTIPLQLYRFSELSEAAKQYVLNECLDININYDWWQSTYSDFAALCKTIAIEVDVEQIHFRGFYSQGDGSSFKGTADFLTLTEAIRTKAWKEYAPNLEFDFAAVPMNSRIYQLLQSGRMTTKPRISPNGNHTNISARLHWHFEEHRCTNYDRIDEAMIAVDQWFSDVSATLNNFLYRCLEKGYAYETSETAIIQAIEANNNWFTAEGRCANRLYQLSQSHPFTENE